MTDNETVNVIHTEINKSPFATTYVISGTALRNLLRMSEHSVTRQITMNSLRSRNNKLRSQLDTALVENAQLKLQLQNRTEELV